MVFKKAVLVLKSGLGRPVLVLKKWVVLVL